MLKRTFYTIIFLLFTVATVFSESEDEDRFQGKTIVDIRFTGLDTVSPTELNGLVRGYISMDYTDSLLYEIQSKLYALDYFELILPNGFDGDEDGNTVILEFEVKERPVISSIEFAGNQKVRKGELLDIILLKRGDMVIKTSIKLDETAIKELYLEKGFLDVVVSSEIVRDSETNSSVIVYTIEEGTQTKIKEIVFIGNDKYVSDNKLRSLMTTKIQSIFNKGVFQENKLEEDKRLIAQYYHDRGYIDGEVYDVEKEIIKDEEKNINFLKISLFIKEGEQYIYQGMTFEGNKIYSSEELIEITLQKPSKIYNESKFLADYTRVIDLYMENGYIGNSFSKEEIRDDQKREISFKVTIVERPRYHIGKIIIQGNDKTKEKVILRELPFEVGDIFNKTKIIEGTYNLLNTGLFSNVVPSPVESSPGLMDLVINVEEARSTDIMFGVAISGGDGFPVSGQISLTEKNFLGNGQTFGASTAFSPESQDVSVRFIEPRLFGLPWYGGANISYKHKLNKNISRDNNGDNIEDGSHEDFQMEYQSHSISAGFQTGYTWYTSLAGRIGISTGISAGFDYVTYDSIYNPLSSALRSNLNTWQYNDRWWTKMSWDKRDLTINSNKGFILSEKFTIAGVLPMTVADYLESVTRFDVYFTLFDIPVVEDFNFKSVLKLHTALTYLAPKPGGAPVDVQRYGSYIDGMFRARGWAPETGGQSLWDNTIELRFPLVKNVLAFDIFMDMVGMWGSKEDFTNMVMSDFRFSIGAGLRLANPSFPFALYLVKKFQFNDDNRTINWNPESERNHIGDFSLVISFGIDLYQ